jgi:hypothetical protein
LDDGLQVDRLRDDGVVLVVHRAIDAIRANTFGPVASCSGAADDVEAVGIDGVGEQTARVVPGLQLVVDRVGFLLTIVRVFKY